MYEIGFIFLKTVLYILLCVGVVGLVLNLIKIFIYKENTMSEEMREQINKIKNFGQFLNEDVNKNITLYHGSDELFSEFELNSDKSDGFNAFGDGVYFVDKFDEAKTYGSYVYEVRVNIRKIFDIDKNYNKWENMKDNNDDYTQDLVNLGYDAIKLDKNWFKIYVIFNVDNIKIINISNT